MKSIDEGLNYGMETLSSIIIYSCGFDVFIFLIVVWNTCILVWIISDIFYLYLFIVQTSFMYGTVTFNSSISNFHVNIFVFNIRAS